MSRIAFTADDLSAIAFERYHHPEPFVQRKLEVLWLKSQGVAHHDIARLTWNLSPQGGEPIDKVVAWVEHRFQTRYAPIIVVAEGAHPSNEELSLTSGNLDAFGHVRLGGVGQLLAEEIEKRSGKEARCTVLGHIQRGGTPTAFDRVLATRFGLHAVAAVHDEAFGMMVALRGTEIVRVPLAEATSQLKLVPPQRYAEAEVFFG